MANPLSSSVLDELNTAEAKALHEITHKLSSCGVGKIVNLPQIIVVGEQSAGKSSVLEAISRVRFPVHNDICTRFATELVLRQARQTRVDVSVRFDDKSKAPKAFQKTGFNEDDLPGIIKEAKACMGIAATGKDFSRDVLRLEIEGPNMYPLTLVDLPGIFHVSTDQQSEPGRETVNRIVESYMKKKNSIILVVIPASNQLANNYALKVVMQVDPKRKRTLGVITKPDCTRPGSSDERKYIQLAKNQETTHKLKLGWHVLRNRSEDEENLDDRDALEESFFEETAWRSLYAEDRGIVSLRKKLSKVLYKHIRENIHGVIDDIEGKLRERQTELGRLGRPRSKPEEMRSFLLTIAGEFQRLARDGIHGQYSDRFFGDLDTTENKFRALLRNFNRAFDYVLATKGSTLTISPPDGAELPPTKAPAFLTEFLEAYPYEFPDPTPISRQVLNEQLQRQAASNQGREFPGLPNRELVTQLFQKQALPWGAIAQFHIKQVTLVAKAFVDQLFRHVLGPPDASATTEAILRICVDRFFTEKEKVLRDKMDELLRPYVRGYAMPLDSDFHRTRLERSRRQVTMAAAKLINAQPEDVFTPWKEKAREAVSNLVMDEESPFGSEFGTEVVIDMMETYYEMSLRTFTDNIVNLAIEGCLVCDIPDILTPTKVDGMTNEELEALAAETDDAQSRRDHLQAEIEILREGLEQCRKYKPRDFTVIPPARPAVGAPAVQVNAASDTSRAASRSTSSTPARVRTPRSPSRAVSPAPSGGLSPAAATGRAPSASANSPCRTASPTPSGGLATTITGGSSEHKKLISPGDLWLSYNALDGNLFSFDSKDKQTSYSLGPFGSTGASSSNGSSVTRAGQPASPLNLFPTTPAVSSDNAKESSSQTSTSASTTAATSQAKKSASSSGSSGGSTVTPGASTSSLSEGKRPASSSATPGAANSAKAASLFPNPTPSNTWSKG